MTEIPTNLIEKALALTGRKLDYTMREMKVDEYGAFDDISMSKFCYYLLSPEFIHEYYGKYWDDVKWIAYPEDYYPVFWTAIWQYQKGNPETLLSLLEKI